MAMPKGTPHEKRARSAEQRQPVERLRRGDTMRRENAAGDALRVSRDAERALPATRRIEHRAEDGGGHRAHPAGCHEAWELLDAGQRGTGGIQGPSWR